MKSEHKQAWNTLRKIAKQEGVSVRYVTESIERAAKEAYNNANRLGDFQSLMMWNAIPKAGDFPSEVEILTYMGKRFEQR